MHLLVGEKRKVTSNKMDEIEKKSKAMEERMEGNRKSDKGTEMYCFYFS